MLMWEEGLTAYRPRICSQQLPAEWLQICPWGRSSAYSLKRCIYPPGSAQAVEMERKIDGFEICICLGSISDTCFSRESVCRSPPCTDIAIPLFLLPRLQGGWGIRSSPQSQAQKTSLALTLGRSGEWGLLEARCAGCLFTACTCCVLVPWEKWPVLSLSSGK